MAGRAPFLVKSAVLLALIGAGAAASPAPHRAPQWTSQLTGAPALNDLAFPSSTEGWAVGSAGAVYRTLDGAAWSVQALAASTVLNGVAFVTNDLGLAAGDTHTLLRTADGTAGGPGSSWTGTVTGDLLAVHARNANNIWAVGATRSVRRTPNGGTDWFVAEGSATLPTPRAVAAAGAGTLEAYVVGDGGQFRSTIDGGKTWAGTTVGILGNMKGIGYVSGTSPNAVLWAVGAGGKIRKTVDSGGTWADPGTNNATDDLNAICVGNATFAWAVGNSGQIVRTDNGGSSFDVMTTPLGFSTPLNGVALAPSGPNWAGVAVGNATSLYTIDGATWTEAPVAGVTFRAAAAVNATTMIAVGDAGKMYKFDVPSATWTQKAGGLTTENLTGVTWDGVGTGWAVGSKGLLIRVTSSGDTWTIVGQGTNESLKDVAWATSLIAVAVGTNGEILKSTDGGKLWLRKTNAGANWTTFNLNAIAFANASLAWAVGDNGTLLRTDDAGNNWTSLSSGNTEPLYGIAPLDAAQFVAVGGAGHARAVILNFGAGWTTDVVAPFGTDPLRSVSFPAYTPRGWAAGDNAKVYTTINSGSAWTEELGHGATGNVKAAAFPCQSMGWIADSTGHIRVRDGNAPPVSFPPHVGTPYTWQPPVIDGFIDPELGEDRRPDTGWNRSLQIAFSDGTPLAPLTFRGLRKNSNDLLYFSYEVRSNDWDGDDTVVLLFRGDNPSPRQQHAANDRRIVIHPNPASGAVAAENVNPDSMKTYKWNFGTNVWDEILTALPNVIAKVRRWTSGTDGNCWSVEVQVPITTAADPDWINISAAPAEFLFSFYVLESEGGGVTQFTWPRDLLLSGPTDVVAAPMPACDWGRAKLGTAADTVGVHIKEPHLAYIGMNNTSQNDPATTTIHGLTTNYVVARVVNDGVADATNVKATFRIADWGVQMGDPLAGAWREIQPVTNDNRGPATVPTGVSPANEHLFWFTWALTSQQQTDYSPIAKQHQCLLVTLDSTDNVIFSERSNWTNMQYSASSVFEQDAFISSKGYGHYGAKNGAQRFFLTVHPSRFDFDPKSMPLDTVAPPGKEDAQRLAHTDRKDEHPYYSGENLKRVRLQSFYPNLKGEKTPVGYFTWLLRAAKETPNTVKIRGHVRPILQQAGGFGYVARHDKAVESWAHEFSGAQITKLKENYYQVDVPVENSVQAHTQLKSTDKGTCGEGGGVLGLILALGLFLVILFWFLRKK